MIFRHNVACPLYMIRRPAALNQIKTSFAHTLATDANSNNVIPERWSQIGAEAVEPSGDIKDQKMSPGQRKENAIPDALVSRHLSNQHIRKKTGSYGGNLRPCYEEQSTISNPPRPCDVTLELLLASQAHLGHATSLWNPANSRYIFGIRSGIHIISLDVIAQHLRRAARIVNGVAQRGGLILFVGTRPGFDTCVVKAAEMAAPAYHLFQRWTPGSLTNGQQILGKCRMKVVDEFDNEVHGLDDLVRERKPLKPDLVICLNPIENRVLLHECALVGIPTMGIIDTDANPTWVTYPIPGNDDSLRCVQVIAGVLGRAGQEGQEKRKQAAAKGVVTYTPDELLKLPSNFDPARHRS